MIDQEPLEVGIRLAQNVLNTWHQIFSRVICLGIDRHLRHEPTSFRLLRDPLMPGLFFWEALWDSPSSPLSR